MKQKYWLCKRKNVFFGFDSETGKRESLCTGDKEEAKRIIRAKNDAATQPSINISIAKAYLVGTDARLFERTWAFGMQVKRLLTSEPRRQQLIEWLLVRTKDSPAWKPVFDGAIERYATGEACIFGVLVRGGIAPSLNDLASAHEELADVPGTFDIL